MSVRKEITAYDGIYFITITNARWIRLFEIINGYDIVYKWFDYLKTQGHFIVGYVLMPNHFHVIIAFRNTQGKTINSIIGEGKRFMAYQIVSRLKKGNQKMLLDKLSSFVNRSEKQNGKIHEVFEPSFDWKECPSVNFIEQKLNYIHNNPCAKSWNLALDIWSYVHSSAEFYASGRQGVYVITPYSELEDIDLTTPWVVE